MIQIRKGKKETIELYNLTCDLAETKDLHKENPEIAQTLKTELEKMGIELAKNGKMKTSGGSKKK
ncbi:MAG: hypothetical protein ABFR90_05285 [Planctomycetota bacterium]